MNPLHPPKPQQILPDRLSMTCLIVRSGHQTREPNPSSYVICSIYVLRFQWLSQPFHFESAL
ncbi:hypothetical protein PAXRUDRAFT_788853 [Paxillus rubicundulus Ve08.2h10]|uniref:Uncharacterized protein n=1 Tax=Paxillus rubicundulus Ve08.2h10 TaxID=930991 RepID=A0A0D0CUG8_9AGAM|nr:hypothetical protein PAXRUDRAFT_788853 [Paxillus rubicundulus Ve08.2h10]